MALALLGRPREHSRAVRWKVEGPDGFIVAVAGLSMLMTVLIVFLILRSVLGPFFGGG
jgi:hypothetical protein